MTNSPQDTATHKIIIDDAYKEYAIDIIKTIAQGNNCEPDDVTLESFEGEVLTFQAENMLTILRKHSEKQMPGQIQGPVKVDNETAAKNAMSNAYLTLSEDTDMERKIREVILNREDKIFGISNEIIPLPFWKKEYVTFEPCNTCKTTGTVKCMPCSGKGIEQCPRCHGAGQTHCTHCNGAQMIQAPNGQRIQCTICHGTGRTGCTQCRQSGTIKCKVCRSRGSTPCPNCQGNAWTSKIYIMEIEARTAFDYPRDKVPDQVSSMIDKHGAKIKDHAQIIISQTLESAVNQENEDKIQEQKEAAERQDFIVPVIYEVTLPYGHIEFNIKGKTYYTFLFGTKNKLTHVSPFLDDLTKEGLRKLKDAAELRGDVTENLKAAAQYRTIKEGIIASASYSANKATKALRSTNKIGLSPENIKDIISTADIALKNITNKPRTMGTIFSVLINLIIFAGYFFAARTPIIEKIANPTLHHIADGLILIITAYIGTLTIQMTAQSALTKTLNALLPEGIKRSAPPKLGDKLYVSLAASAIIFSGLYYFTVLN